MLSSPAAPKIGTSSKPSSPFFLSELLNVRAAGEESGLGRQICGEAAQQFSWNFTSVNFSSKKHDLGFTLMNQLSVAQKRIPRSQQDIAQDYFALRKSFNGNKWAFSEGRNALNPASHCDIAWAGALASHAHTENRPTFGCAIGLEDGTIISSDDFPSRPLTPEEEQKAHDLWLQHTNDPRIWQSHRM